MSVGFSHPPRPARAPVPAASASSPVSAPPTTSPAAAATAHKHQKLTRMQYSDVPPTDDPRARVEVKPAVIPISGSANQYRCNYCDYNRDKQRTITHQDTHFIWRPLACQHCPFQVGPGWMSHRVGTPCLQNLLTLASGTSKAHTEMNICYPGQTDRIELMLNFTCYSGECLLESTCQTETLPVHHEWWCTTFGEMYILHLNCCLNHPGVITVEVLK